MGYRDYIGAIEKDMYELVHDLTEPEIKNYFGVDQDDCFQVRKHLEICEIFELGKYCDFHGLGDVVKPIFEEEMSWDSDEEYFVGDEELFEFIIEHYRKRVYNHYKVLLQDFDKRTVDIKQYLEDKLYVWDVNHITPYDLNLSRDIVVRSWKYEYSIFELVRLCKTFDWENCLVTYTWY